MSKPVIMFLVIGLTFVFILLSPTKVIKSEQHAPLSDPNSDYSVHNHSPSSTVVQELVVRATEFTFTPTSTRVVVGQKIKITLNNTGQEEHDFQIVGTNIHLHATPGKESSMIVSLDKAGYYQVICTLPGHKEAGMTASIQVINP